MGVKIDIKGSKISGNSQVLNDMTVKGKNDVNINVENTKMSGGAKVLSDIHVQNGKLSVNLNGVEFGKNVDFMNGREFKNSGMTTENIYQNVQQQNDSESFQFQQRQSTQQTQSMHLVQPKQRKGFIQRIKDFFRRDKHKESESETTELIFELGTTDLHKEFENKISRNGTLKGINNRRYVEKSDRSSSIEMQHEEERY